MREEDVHPYLPCGYNSCDNDGDEIDGAGVNEAVWPVLFDTFLPLMPMIVTTEMMDAFDGCADLVIPGLRNTVVIPAESRTLMIVGHR